MVFNHGALSRFITIACTVSRRPRQVVRSSCTVPRFQRRCFSRRLGSATVPFTREETFFCGSWRSFWGSYRSGRIGLCRSATRYSSQGHLPMDSANPVVRFYRLAGQARPPQRADRSACGTLPTRAYRYCEAVTSASAFGWWVFPPIDLQLMWDGSDVFWYHDGADDWMPLLPSAQLPGFAAEFDRASPDRLTGFAPPFLTALPEAGAVQIWTGLMVRTRPDWHLLVRRPLIFRPQGGSSFTKASSSQILGLARYSPTCVSRGAILRYVCGLIFLSCRSNRSRVRPMPVPLCRPHLWCRIWGR